MSARYKRSASTKEKQHQLLLQQQLEQQRNNELMSARTIGMRFKMVK